jgi:hypothetical protein
MEIRQKRSENRIKNETYKNFLKRYDTSTKKNQDSVKRWIKAVEEDFSSLVEKKLLRDIKKVSSILGTSTSYGKIKNEINKLGGDVEWLGIFLERFIETMMIEGLGKMISTLFKTTEDYNKFRDQLMVTISVDTPNKRGAITALKISLSNGIIEGQDILQIASMGGDFNSKNAMMNPGKYDRSIEIGDSFLRRYVMPFVEKNVSTAFYKDKSIVQDLEKLIGQSLSKLEGFEEGSEK